MEDIRIEAFSTIFNSFGKLETTNYITLTTRDKERYVYFNVYYLNYYNYT